MKFPTASIAAALIAAAAVPKAAAWSSLNMKAGKLLVYITVQYGGLDRPNFALEHYSETNVTL